MVLYYQQTNTDNQIKENRSTYSINEPKDRLGSYLLNAIDYQHQKIKTHIFLSISFCFFCLFSQLTKLFIKIFDFFTKYLPRCKKKSRHQTSFIKNLKSIVVICLLSSSETVSASNQNSTGLNKTLNCEKVLKKRLFYDENLFKELKMNETLINLYRSCYKDAFHEYKSSSFFVPNPGQRECFINQIEPNHILYELIFNKDKKLIPQSVLDRIDLVCNDNQLMDLDRAFFLIEYEHSLCGNIFKNSVKNSYLKEYIFKENDQVQHSNKIHSVSSRHHHNRRYDFPRVMSQKLYSIANSSNKPNEANSSKFRNINLNSQKTHLNNCSLILLNVYLLSHTASCSFDDFVESLNHFDCMSNYFSVRSNCNKCQNAYKKWLCSSMIPYFFENDILAKPCQHYCYTVENMCPFFRPTDSYGGQPVFHCRNVVQVMESKPDGYEDDDENYIDEDKFDDDRCYGECRDTNKNQTQMKVDLNLIIKEKMSSLVYSNSNFIQNLSIDSMFDIWIKLKSNQNSNINRFAPSKVDFSSSFNSKGRFNNFDECLFGFQPVISSSGQLLKYNSVINFVLIILFKFLIP
ncbi:hypothetical protein BpHYR1_017186 [Brachionus plicatilis]|uniref:Uncharacterized protein n=1 Tax=Brachionus plicatilis TaxID=10195 RepID=A0A3M7QIG1_BRAPC|nr:hypothetical protein BpHYR1_017186 [Brachionus plicatilis]